MIEPHRCQFYNKSAKWFAHKGKEFFSFSLNIPGWMKALVAKTPRITGSHSHKSKVTMTTLCPCKVHIFYNKVHSLLKQQLLVICLNAVVQFSKWALYSCMRSCSVLGKGQGDMSKSSDSLDISVSLLFRTEPFKCPSESLILVRGLIF